MKIYATADLGLAASLSASGFRVTDLNRGNPRRIEFEFEDTAELQNAIDLYWKSELLVSGVTLMDHIKQLKSRIYSS